MSETATQIPYSWLRVIDPKLKEIDNVPLFGHCPEFPWKEFSKVLSQRFQYEELTLEKGEVLWRAETELYQDFGDNLHIFEVGFAGLEGSAFLIIKKEDFLKMSANIAGDIPLEELSSFNKDIRQAFEDFISSEVLYSLSQVSFDNTLSPHLTKEASTPTAPCLSIHIHLKMGLEHISMRLLLTSDLLSSWRKKYEDHSLHLSVRKELLTQIDYTFGLEIGRTLCSKEELNSLKEGDILLLDRITINPEENSGTLSLTLEGKPHLTASFENNSIKIQKPPSLYQTLSELKSAKQKDDENA